MPSRSGQFIGVAPQVFMSLVFHTWRIGTVRRSVFTSLSGSLPGSAISNWVLALMAASAASSRCSVQMPCWLVATSHSWLITPESATTPAGGMPWR